MKKWIAAIACLGLILALSACGRKDNETNGSSGGMPPASMGDENELPLVPIG